MLDGFKSNRALMQLPPAALSAAKEMAGSCLRLAYLHEHVYLLARLLRASEASATEPRHQWPTYSGTLVPRHSPLS
jgi:hypothetical protein